MVNYYSREKLIKIVHHHSTNIYRESNSLYSVLAAINKSPSKDSSQIWCNKHYRMMTINPLKWRMRKFGLYVSQNTFICFTNHELQNMAPSFQNRMKKIEGLAEALWNYYFQMLTWAKNGCAGNVTY